MLNCLSIFRFDTLVNIEIHHLVDTHYWSHFAKKQEVLMWLVFYFRLLYIKDQKF